MKKIMMPMMAGFTVIVILMLGMWIFYDKSVQEIEQQGLNAAIYDRHYAMIAGTDDYPLWQSIYENARAKAAEENVYLEWLDENTASDYSISDCMEIAMAAKVDGIILHTDQTAEVTQLIDEAMEQNIPVVTVLNDDNASERISFVGLNSYQMGNIYGEQILRLMNKTENQVMLLLNSSEDVNMNLMYSQISATVEAGKDQGQTAKISTYSINASTNFDAEEAIRDIFVNSETIPDILICQDAVSTECAYQAIVDYNEVGNVNIIGYYDSSTILDAIKKELIPVTISINTEEVARYSISALDEYLSQGYVSNYFNVGIDVVTKDNVDEFTA